MRRKGCSSLATDEMSGLKGMIGFCQMILASLDILRPPTGSLPSVNLGGSERKSFVSLC